MVIYNSQFVGKIKTIIYFNRDFLNFIKKNPPEINNNKIDEGGAK